MTSLATLKLFNNDVVPSSVFFFSNGRSGLFYSNFHLFSFLKLSQRTLLFYLSSAFFPQTVVETPSLLPFSSLLCSNGRRNPFSSTFQQPSFLKRSQRHTLFDLIALSFSQTVVEIHSLLPFIYFH